mmetsp:Transcript_120110/g.285360  ORF Transcript_120110/g.285360 Transcript_120110/m.285360 type:complete len:233 (+) Transcript_120110:45-743(+)
MQPQGLHDKHQQHHLLVEPPANPPPSQVPSKAAFRKCSNWLFLSSRHSSSSSLTSTLDSSCMVSTSVASSSWSKMGAWRLKPCFRKLVLLWWQLNRHVVDEATYSCTTSSSFLGSFAKSALVMKNTSHMGEVTRTVKGSGAGNGKEPNTPPTTSTPRRLITPLGLESFASAATFPSLPMPCKRGWDAAPGIFFLSPGFKALKGRARSCGMLHSPPAFSGDRTSALRNSTEPL